MGETEDSKMRKPQFAIVKLGSEVNPAEFYSLLSKNGHMEVSFVHDLWESPYLQGKKEELLKKVHQVDSPAAEESPSVPVQDSPTPSIVVEEAMKPSSIDATINRIAQPLTISRSNSPERDTDFSASFQIKPRTVTKPPKNPDAPTVTCSLCDNQIMATRLSNLTNHVRRHATMKQYSCMYCIYNHNEMAKVRLHMMHNHKDSDNVPQDNLNAEMQKQWDDLMERCFPNFDAKTLRSRSGPTHVCIECGESFRESLLDNHIQMKHRDECHPYNCGKCAYENADEWKVRLHIIVRHPNEAAMISVNSLPADNRFGLYRKKYFPTIQAGTDEEEEILFSQLRDLTNNEAMNGGGGTSTSERGKVTSIPKIACQLCHKQLDAPGKSLANVFSHAKRHCKVKQYQCPRCEYSTSESSHIRTHILVKHQNSEKPIENKKECCVPRTMKRHKTQFARSKVVSACASWNVRESELNGTASARASRKYKRPLNAIQRKKHGRG